MIYSIINFLRLQLDTYLSEGKAIAEPMMILSNPWNNNDNSKGASFFNTLSLLNIEEERTFKTQTPQIISRNNGTYALQAPDIKLNLYVLISAYNKNYEESLKFISRVITFYQINNVFDKPQPGNITNTPLPDGVERIIVELYSPTFEQQNQIWASLSTGYLPSVIYKLRTIVINAGLPVDNEAYKTVQKIDVTSNVINA